jgi:hypothetical protein
MTSITIEKSRSRELDDLMKNGSICDIYNSDVYVTHAVVLNTI